MSLIEEFTDGEWTIRLRRTGLPEARVRLGRDATTGIPAVFYGTLARVPARKVACVYMWHGATTEHMDAARTIAVLAARGQLRDWQWRKRRETGSIGYKFTTLVGLKIDVDESFAQITAQLGDVSRNPDYEGHVTA